jgi:magnesium and cobalt transporter
MKQRTKPYVIETSGNEKGTMGDTTEGSSSAAQSAQDHPDNSERGFWGRIIDVLTPPSESAAADETAGKAVLPAAGSNLPGILNLRRMRVEDVMVPKADIISVPSDIRKDDLYKVFKESGLTRLPVYKGTLDSPIGLVHLKDFALNHGFNGKGTRFSLKSMIRPLLYAPPSMPIGVLLQKMQNERSHMALVIDEYGGVDGLVTIEDLIEQVVGEIEDEHDLEDDSYWTVEKPGCYLAMAKTPLDELEAEIGRSLTDGLDDEEIDTLGGLIFLLAGRVPARGEVVRHPAGPEFEVVDADPRRVKRLRMRLAAASGDD